jgi:hypothetical protein
MSSTSKCEPEPEYPGEVVPLKKILFMHNVAREIVGFRASLI